MCNKAIEYKRYQIIVITMQSRAIHSRDETPVHCVSVAMSTGCVITSFTNK